MAPSEEKPAKRARKPAAAKPATKPTRRKPVARNAEAVPERRRPVIREAAAQASSWEDDPTEWGELPGANGTPHPGSDPSRTLGDWLEAVIPPEAQVHFLRAGQELLTGVSLTVDHHLNRGRSEDGGAGRAVRIEID